MKNTHALALEKIYSDFSKGDWTSFFANCAPTFSFQVAGKSKLAGKFTSANFAQGYAAQLKELSGGTHQFEIHDILASDLHGTVLGSHKITRDGKTTELRTVQVWRFENGKPLAGYEYPRDLYQYDAIWS